HYRRPIHYSQTTVEEARTNLNRLQTAYSNASYRLQDAKEELPGDEKELEKIRAFKEEFIEKMDDDFNAANGLTVLYEIAKQLNVYSECQEVSKTVLEQIMEQLSEMLSVFGVELKQETELLDSEIEQLIEDRNTARKNKDFQKADDIRDELKSQGILLEDTPQGVRWKREETR